MRRANSNRLRRACDCSTGNMQLGCCHLSAAAKIVVVVIVSACAVAGFNHQQHVGFVLAGEPLDAAAKTGNGRYRLIERAVVD